MNETRKNLFDLGYETIRELETETGILASGKEEIYGCVFGRDSLITALKLLRAYDNTRDEYLLSVVRKAILSLADLQGKEVNIESGEEPGKIIHEYRPNDHEFLTVHLEDPWYVYEDGVMRIYDSVDSTPLFLMTIYRYVKASGDTDFLNAILPNVRRALQWVVEHGDKNGDGFLDYELPSDRTHGGLTVHSWMDSNESLFHEDGTTPVYPVAPVEAQAYAYAALRMWGKMYEETDHEFSELLQKKAFKLKYRFNEQFVIDLQDGLSLASFIDGNGKASTSVRSTMGHVLWAAWYDSEMEKFDSVLEDRHVPNIAYRLLRPDMFVPGAGIRTLSTHSTQFSVQSYHNGSIWPHDTSIVIEGLENFGFVKQAERVRESLLTAYEHFGTPLELFTYDENGLAECYSETGQAACRKQAWSAAALVSEAVSPQPEMQNEKEPVLT